MPINFDDEILEKALKEPILPEGEPKTINDILVEMQELKKQTTFNANPEYSWIFRKGYAREDSAESTKPDKPQYSYRNKFSVPIYLIDLELSENVTNITQNIIFELNNNSIWEPAGQLGITIPRLSNMKLPFKGIALPPNKTLDMFIWFPDGKNDFSIAIHHTFVKYDEDSNGVCACSP